MDERIEDLQRELREVRRQIAGLVRRKRGVPFVEEIMLGELLTSFRSIPFEYDGSYGPYMSF